MMIQLKFLHADMIRLTRNQQSLKLKEEYAGEALTIGSGFPSYKSITPETP